MVKKKDFRKKNLFQKDFFWKISIGNGLDKN